MSDDTAKSLRGRAVSVICTDGTTYQGVFLRAGIVEQTITITNVIRNGTQSTEKEVTIMGTDVLQANLLEGMASSVPEIKQSIHTVPVMTEHLEAKAAPTAATVRSSPAPKHFRASPTRVHSPSSAYIKPRRQHRASEGDDRGDCEYRASVRKNGARAHKMTAVAAAATANNGRRETKRNKDDKNPVAKNFNEEFDFELNLALFDKKAVAHEMKNGTTKHPSPLLSAAAAALQSVPHPTDTEVAGQQQQQQQQQQQRQRQPAAGGRAKKHKAVETTDTDYQQLRQAAGRSRKHQTCVPKTAEVDTMATDFDFESNLAMFNKVAIYEEIENGTAVAPPTWTDSRPPPPAKYGCHENVLRSSPVEFRQIRISTEPACDSSNGGGSVREEYVTDSGLVVPCREYVTDSGLVVPCIDCELRERLMEAAEQAGLSRSRQLETVGRSATEMVLQLCGGSHRLSPKNAHQRPCVVILAGPHYQGCQALSTARQLDSHQVRVTVLMPRTYAHTPMLDAELKLLAYADNATVTSNIKDLPQSPLDIIIDAVVGGSDEAHDDKWHRAIAAWVSSVRAPVLALDPPPSTTTAPAVILAKWQLTVGLPLAPVPAAPAAPALYLADLCIPRQIYQQVSIDYLSPFEHKFVVALHPKEEQSPQ